MICYNIGIFLPDFRGGGAEKVMITLGNKLSSEGFNVFFYVKTENGPNRDNLDSSIKVHILEGRNALQTSYSIKKSCDIDNIEVALGTLGMAHSISLSKLLGNKAKCVARLGNTISRDIDNWSGFRRFSMILYQYVLLFSDKIVFQSKDMELDFFKFLKIKINKEKYTQIYNPIDSDKIDTLKDETIDVQITSIDIVSVGRLSSQKNYFLALDIFSGYLNKHPKAKYHILGTGEQFEPLREYTNRLGISDSVIFHGYVENPYPYLKKSGAFLLTSKYEGFSNALLEAVYLKVPVVASDVPGGNSEIVLNGINGYLFDDSNVSQGVEFLIKSQKMSVKNSKLDIYNLDYIFNKYLKAFGFNS